LVKLRPGGATKGKGRQLVRKVGEWYVEAGTSMVVAPACVG
jgi:hypothetical protein